VVKVAHRGVNSLVDIDWAIESPHGIYGKRSNSAVGASFRKQ
jgi:hypothetical protein